MILIFNERFVLIENQNWQEKMNRLITSIMLVYLEIQLGIAHPGIQEISAN
jgi:hypothetical protein